MVFGLYIPSTLDYGKVDLSALLLLVFSFGAGDNPPRSLFALEILFSVLSTPLSFYGPQGSCMFVGAVL